MDINHFCICYCILDFFKVTAILKVTHINHLLNAPYGPDLVRSGQKALEPVLNMFIKKTVEQTRPATPVSALFKPEKNSFGNF